MTGPTVFERVEELLRRHGVEFQILRHAPVYTSQEAASVRGTPLSSGAKALVVKVDNQMKPFVMPADRKLASKKVRALCEARRVRFASAQEVLELTGLKPGAIPPFGSLFGLATVCDPRLGENPSINFNAGDHGISVSITYDAYLVVEHPAPADISE